MNVLVRPEATPTVQLPHPAALLSVLKTSYENYTSGIIMKGNTAIVTNGESERRGEKR